MNDLGHLVVKKKSMRWSTASIGALCVVMVAGLVGCEQFGAIPKGEKLQQAQQSPQYDLEQNIFVNRRPGILDTMTVWERFWADPFGLDEPNFLFNSNQTEPEQTLPQVTGSNLNDFNNSAGKINFIWLGHWTVLMSIDGKTILVDPVFSDHASPVAIAAKRFQPPAISLDQLPPIDHIVISHDHYDHLDMETIKFFVDKDATFLTPLGVGAHLRYWGIEEDRITELDWWDEVTLDGLTYTAAPAQHFSGRIGVMHSNKTLWASWVLKSKGKSVFFSGDSGYDTHYKAIGDALGPFDLVFMDYGQYDEGWRAVHNLPEEGIQGFQELGGDYLVPVGWGMFNLAVHNWYDPPKEATRLAKAEGIKLITPRFGQIISMDNPPLFDEWWLTLENSQ